MKSSIQASALPGQRVTLGTSSRGSSLESERHQIADGFLAVVICLTASMEFMLSSSGGTTLSELTIYLGAFSLGVRSGFYKRRAHAVIAFCVLLAVLTLVVRGWDRVYAPYLKTFLTFSAALVVWDHLGRKSRQRDLVFRTLTMLGATIAAYSILQAISGFGALPDIYQIGGVPSAAKAASPVLEGELFRLLGVMRWKVAQINDALGFRALNGLGYGFHWFSVNMAEYLVFVAVAGWISLTSERRNMVSLACLQVLLATAIVLSGSRTALIGLIVVNLGLALLIFPRWRVILISVSLVAATSGAVFLDWTPFFFDNGGTVEGRAELNGLALSYATSDVLSIAIGGDVAAFSRAAYSNVHFTFLYYWIYGGIFVAIAMFSLFVAWTILPIVRQRKATDSREKALYAGCGMAMVWFLLYGSTWAAVALPNTIILVSLFASVASRRRGVIEI